MEVLLAHDTQFTEFFLANTYIELSTTEGISESVEALHS